MQRQTALKIPLRARNLVPIQPSADPYFDSFATEAQRRIHRLAHGAAESNSLFELQSNRLGNQLRVELRFVHFLNVEIDLARGPLLNISFELVDLRAFAPNNDSWTRSLDDHSEFIAGALDLNRTDAG